MHKIESSLLNIYRDYLPNTENLKEKDKTLFIAYSGGLDSSVLLYASKQLLDKCLISKVHALHVNHGLASESDNWQIHCQSICDKYSIELSSKELKLLSSLQNPTENVARNARYEFFQTQLEENSLIAFAHHQDDQAETLLFRLFRGAGIAGASAIPESRKLGAGKIIRPLLNVSKNELLVYAEKNRLRWIEDPSNFENGYSRNIIRNTILPLIKKSWPKVSEALSRFTQIANEQNEILLEVASNDLSVVSAEHYGQIELSLFVKLSKARQKNVLHYWIVSHSKSNYSRATHQEIEELLLQLEGYFSDTCFDSSKACKLNVKLGSFRVRFYDEKLWLCEFSEPEKLAQPVLWYDILQPINVLNNRKTITTESESRISALTIRMPINGEVVTIRPRVGGEKVKPHYRDKSCELKKIYQELNIPHWKRDWLPIIYYDENIVCVPGVFANKYYLSDNKGSAISYILSEHN